MPFGDVDKIAKLVPDTLNITLDDAFRRARPWRGGQGRAEVAELWQIAKRSGGARPARRQARRRRGHLRRAADRARPALPAPKSEEIITQYPMGPIEKLGLLKMDFLGLRTLTVIANTVELIEESRGVRIDPERIPLDDAKTYQLLAERGPSACSSWSRRGCGTRSPSSGPSDWRTSSRWSRSTGRGRWR